MLRRATRELEVAMRRLASSLAALALIAVARAPLSAQHVDSALVGRWLGHAQPDASWAVRRPIDVRLDIQPTGAVSGTVGDAVLADANIYTDSRVARALKLGREFAIEGNLAGPLCRAEGVQRSRVRFSLDRTLDRLTGEMQTSGIYGAPPSECVLTARVTLDRVGPMVAGQGAAPISNAPAGHPLSP